MFYLYYVRKYLNDVKKHGDIVSKKIKKLLKNWKKI